MQSLTNLPIASFPLLLLLASLLAAQQTPPAPLADADRDLTAQFVLSEAARGELEVTLFASSPQLFNPTNVDVDARGRLWVTEAVNYRRFNTAKEGRLFRPQGDRVVILEDTDGDGVCDSSKVFVQDAELTSPLGIAVFGPPDGPRELFVSCSPNVFKYVDADGDDVPDRRETFLTGFGGFDHDHGVHALVAGPDGALWFNAGNAGPHVVTDADGWTLRSSSFASGGVGDFGAPQFLSDDGRRWIGGLALRIERDGGGLRPIAHNFRNCYEVAIDSFGELWQNDNDDDGNQGCRIAWVMPGGNYGYASGDGARSWEVDRRPGQSTLTAHWHQDDPGVMPLGANTGGGGPTGIVVYESDALGPAFEQALFSCDAGRGTVWWCVPNAVGAGYELTPRPFLAPAPAASDEARGWFRPSDVAVGLDGALYVADWWDAGVGGHGMQDDLGGGRILRIARKGSDRGATRRIANEFADFQTLPGLVTAFRSPAVNVRGEAMRRLAESGEGVRGPMGALIKSGRPYERARATWLLARARQAGPEVGLDAVTSDDPRLRALAWRITGPDQIARESPLWATMAADPSPAVRREVALSLRGQPFADARPLLLALAAALDPRDRVELEAFGLACAGHEAELWPDLVAQLGDVPAKWSERFAALAWRLHPPAAIDGLVARALLRELAPESRRRAVDALAFVHDARAADAMVELALHGPPDVAPLAAFWVKLLDGREWKAFAPARKLGLGSHDPKDARWRSGVVRAGLRGVDVDVTGARALWLVVSDGGDGFSCDWADWIEPTLLGPANGAAGEARESLRLTELPWLVASAGWGDVHVDANCGGGPLAIGGARARFGLGTHAASEIGFLLPPGRFTRFTAKAGPDDGGTTQGGAAGAPTSIEFLVFADRAGPPAAAEAAAAASLQRTLAARTRLLAADAPDEERTRLAAELALDPAGGAWLIELAARGELADELRAAVAERIFKNPDLAVRALASEQFARPSRTGAPLPGVKELLALPADAARGRELFFGAKAGCSKCHAFGEAGGDVGPALTAIGQKYDRAALLDAILNPSAAIAFGFEPWVVETTAGELLTGFLLADGDPLVLKETQGARRTLAASEVKSRRRAKLSVMPDDVAVGLSAQELADLVTFLRPIR